MWVFSIQGEIQRLHTECGPAPRCFQPSSDNSFTQMFEWGKAGCAEKLSTENRSRGDICKHTTALLSDGPGDSIGGRSLQWACVENKGNVRKPMGGGRLKSAYRSHLCPSQKVSVTAIVWLCGQGPWAFQPLNSWWLLLWGSWNFSVLIRKWSFWGRILLFGPDWLWIPIFFFFLKSASPGLRW